MSDLATFLGDLDLVQYAEVFADNGVDRRALPYLTDDDLKDLGVLLGHRRILLAAISGLQQPAPPTADPLPEAERRPLTVMFCDLVGSTALPTRLDVEDYRDLIRAYQDTCVAVIERSGGYLAKFMGDGILVYFGYPTAQGDDPSRAVHAALDIVAAIAGLTVLPDTPLAVRIGIATGEVIVGDVLGAGGAAERTVLGAPPNLAARLQGAADANQIVIADATHRRLQDTIAVTDLGELSLKGIAAPTRAWRVEGLMTPVIGETADLPPFVGRDTVLTRLDGIWQAALPGHLGVVHVRGQPGIGKSRLIGEFANRLTTAGHPQPIITTWTCSAYHANTPLHPLPPGLVPAAGEVSDTGPAGAAARRHATFAAIAGALAERTAAAPLLLVIDDAHWIDPTTAELLETLGGRLAAHPILIILASRPGETADTLIAALPGEVIDLDGLTDDQSMDLVRSIATEALPEFVRQNIVERAGGLPLFVEELTRVVADGRLTDVPETLQDSLLARLDALGPAKRIVQLASVFGHTFDRDDLARLPETDPDTIASALAQMHAAGLVSQHGTRYTFRHALCREVAYDTLLPTTRRTVHGEIADHLIAGGSDSAELIAHHLAAADRHAEAAPYWRQAGSHSAALWSHAEAANHYHAALDHAAALTGTGWELSVRLDLVDSLRILDRYDAALDQIDRAETIANMIGRDEDWLRIHLLRGNIYSPLGDAERCIASQEAAREAAQRLADPAAEARALSAMADARFNNHQIVSAESAYDACVQVAEANALDSLVPANLALRGHMRVYLCRLADATDDSRRAIDLAVGLGDRRAEIAARGSCLGKALFESGDYAAANMEFVTAGAIAAELGAHRYEALNLVFQGTVALATDARATGARVTGARVTAGEFAAEATALARATGPQFCLPLALGVAARSAATPDACRAALAEAEAILRGRAMAHNPLWFFRDAALAAAAHGWPGEIRRYAQALRDAFAAEPLPWCDLVADGAGTLATWLETADAGPVHTAARDARALGFAAWAAALEQAITEG